MYSSSTLPTGEILLIFSKRCLEIKKHIGTFSDVNFHQEESIGQFRYHLVFYAQYVLYTTHV